jgi:hypothetical protein
VAFRLDFNLTGRALLVSDFSRSSHLVWKGDSIVSITIIVAIVTARCVLGIVFAAALRIIIMAFS